MNDRLFEFWLGRAGSGKTHACLEAIAAQTREQPRGRPLWLLVPEQSSAITEYELATGFGLTGYTRARVVTFEYLQREVFNRLGGRPRRVLDEESRILILRRLIRRHKNDLRVLGNCADLPGLAETLSGTLGEFQAYGWNLETLNSRVDQLAREEDRQSLLASKLADLALIWREYIRELRERDLSDESSLTVLAAERMKSWEELDGLRLWVDGFASFNARERALLLALISRADAAALTLCLDPGFLERRANAPPKMPPVQRIAQERIFINIETTYEVLRGEMSQSGWRLKDVLFPRDNHPTRFDGSSALRYLEAEALTTLSAGPASPAREPEIAPSKCWPGAKIEWLEAADRCAEIQAVAKRIAALCKRDSPGMDSGTSHKWSDFTVITRDLESYSPLIREIFPLYEIPFFIDQRKPISGHPLSRLLISALSLIVEGWRTDAVMDYLKSGLAPMEDPAIVSRIENLARNRWLSGADWLDEREWIPRHSDARRNQSAAQIAGLFRAWLAAAQPVIELKLQLERAETEPAEYLWNFLERLKAPARIESWVESARAERNEESALLHAAAWEETIQLLERIQAIGSSDAGNSPAGARMELREILETVQTAFDRARAGVIPPTLEQVLVGAVDRTRTPRVKGAFVVGMAEGAFPKFEDEDPVFGDGERERLLAGGAELGPDSRRKFDHERFLAYIALTRSSEYLFVSSPMKAGGDGVSAPSSFFRAVKNAFPEANAGASSAPEPERPEAWAARVARAFHTAQAGEDQNSLAAVLSGEPPFFSPYFNLPGNEGCRRRMSATFAALNPPAEARIDPALALEFWRSDPSLSVTAMETYAACPFKFFSGRMLRLDSPRELMPGPAELGSLRHHILSALFQALRDEHGLDWGGIDLARADEVIETAASEAIAGELADQFGRDNVTRTIVSLTAKEMKHFAKALKTMGRRYGFRQTHSEFAFGSKDAARFEIPAGAGLVFVLRGSIDRIDQEYFGMKPQPRVILYDYKSSRRAMRGERLLDGADLQLPAYALALEQIWGGRGAQAAGVFYWPLALGIAPAEGDSEGWAEPASVAWFKNHKIQGLFDQTIAERLDTDAVGGEFALAFALRWTKKKEKLWSNVGGWLEHAAFRSYLDHVRRLLSSRAEEIASGRIPVLPLSEGASKACDLCDFQSFCRITSLGPDAERSLKKISFSDFRKQLGESPS